MLTQLHSSLAERVDRRMTSVAYVFHDSLSATRAFAQRPLRSR